MAGDGGIRWSLRVSSITNHSVILLFLLPLSSLLSLMPPPHLSQSQVVSFFLSLLQPSFSASELGFTHSPAERWLVFFTHKRALRAVLRYSQVPTKLLAGKDCHNTDDFRYYTSSCWFSFSAAGPSTRGMTWLLFFPPFPTLVPADTKNSPHPSVCQHRTALASVESD